MGGTVNIAHHGKCPKALAWDIEGVPCHCPKGWPKVMPILKPVKTAKKPNRTVSKARAAKRRKLEAVKRDVYALVDARDEHMCRNCGAKAEHHHHLTWRSQGGIHSTANVILMCSRCHRAIHDRRLEVLGNGDDKLMFRRKP